MPGLNSTLAGAAWAPGVSGPAATLSVRGGSAAPGGRSGGEGLDAMGWAFPGTRGDVPVHDSRAPDPLPGAAAQIDKADTHEASPYALSTRRRCEAERGPGASTPVRFPGNIMVSQMAVKLGKPWRSHSGVQLRHSRPTLPRCKRGKPALCQRPKSHWHNTLRRRTRFATSPSKVANLATTWDPCCPPEVILRLTAFLNPSNLP
jgi:hypothetical protein